MARGSQELTEQRRNEIIDAAEKLYEEEGFHGVTIKAISERTEFTRPLIYHYFHTKEEILLALLCREYEKWITELSLIREDASSLNRAELAQRIAETFKNREILLRIENMNLFDLEEGSSTQALAVFKTVFFRAQNLMTEILESYDPHLEREECMKICRTFFACLYGVYPFVFPSEKQKAAMQTIGVAYEAPSLTEMMTDVITRILCDRKGKIR